MHAQPAHSPRAGTGWPRVAIPALFVALAILHTWPLATDLGGLSRNDNADAQLNEWIVAWVAHQLPRDPIHLFDANIFYPEPRALAFSEHLLVPSLMVAPLLWLGASPVLAHNVLLILGMALTGWATCLVVSRWTTDTWAGVLAGCLAAFNAHTLTRLPHVQAMHAEFLPLTLLALDRLLAIPNVRHSLQLALWFSLQALSSSYLMAFTAISCVVSALVRPAEWTRARARVTLPFIAAAALVSSLALAFFLYPYYRASVDLGMARSLSEVAMYSASLSDYASTGGRLHYALWSRHIYQAGSGSLFPGITAILLTIVAMRHGIAWSDRRARMLLAIGITGFVLSLGPATPVYGGLYHAFPLLQGIRNTSRFGYLVLVATAGLAGFGLAYLRANARGVRRGGLVAALTAAVIVTANLEAARIPLDYTPYTGLSRIYDPLAAVPDAVVAEFPFPSVRRVADNGPYVLASTRHWKPLVNGYSGFTPASYAEHAAVLSGFPDRASIEMLESLGVTHVVTHGRALGDAIADVRWQESFVLTAGVGEDRLYRLASVR